MRDGGDAHCIQILKIKFNIGDLLPKIVVFGSNINIFTSGFLISKSWNERFLMDLTLIDKGFL